MTHMIGSALQLQQHVHKASQACAGICLGQVTVFAEPTGAAQLHSQQWKVLICNFVDRQHHGHSNCFHDGSWQIVLWKPT